VVCPRSPAAKAPVDWFFEGAQRETATLTAFAAALATGFDQGVLTGSGDGSETSSPPFYRILLDHQPERKRAAEAVLRGEAARLSAGAQVRAYADLGPLPTRVPTNSFARAPRDGSTVPSMDFKCSTC